MKYFPLLMLNVAGSVCGINMWYGSSLLFKIIFVGSFLGTISTLAMIVFDKER